MSRAFDLETASESGLAIPQEFQTTGGGRFLRRLERRAIETLCAGGDRVDRGLFAKKLPRGCCIS